MLRLFRSGGKHTKTIWWAIAIFTVVTFIGGFIFLFGAGLGSSARARTSGAVGSVNGQPITRTDFQTALNEQREEYRHKYNTEPAERDERMIELQTWRQLVAQHLFTQQAREAGLRVHDREVVLALETNPPSVVSSIPNFQTDGKFDINKYRNALRDPNNNWAPFEELVRQQLPMRKLQERLLSSIKLSEPELRDAFRDRYEKLDATVVQITATPDLKVPPPTEADLQRTYLAYRGRFGSGLRSQLEVLIEPKKYGPEEVRAASEQAKGLVRRARSGEDFAALARDYSEGPGADKGGEIQRVLQPSDFGPDLGPRIAALTPGSISEPYQDGGRFIIFKLLGYGPPAKGQPAGVKIAQIVTKVKPNETSLRGQYEALVKLRNRAASIGLGKAAAEKGVATAKTTYYDYDNPPAQLYNSPEVADWGMGAKVGTVSQVYEGIDEFVIAQLAGRHSGGPPPREEIAESIRQIAQMDARVEVSKARADSLARELAGGRTLEQAAKTHGIIPVEIKSMTRGQPDSRLAAVPEVVGALFVTPPGKVAGPIRALNGWYFGRVNQLIPGNPAVYDTLKGQLSSQILTRRQQVFFAGILTEMRARAKIQDLRNEPAY